MSKAVRRGRTDRETLEVLNPFLSVLRSSDDISIPKETLQGALGHFTSTLVGDRLDSFIQDVLSSPSLWKTLQPHQIQAAVRPAPKIKVEALRPTVKDGWIFRNQLDKAAQTWLTEVVKAMKTTPTSSHSLILLIGLLQGLDDVTDIKWGRPRIDLEEEIVIAIGERLDNNSCDLLDMYCPAADHIDSARLRALDLRQVVPRLHVALFTALGYAPPPVPSTYTVQPQLDMDEVTSLSHGLARTFIALSDGGEGSQEFAWAELSAFTTRMYVDCASKLQEEWLYGESRPAKGGPEWERQKAALYAFLAVTWPAVHVMLNPERSCSKKDAVELSTLIVVTLAKFASLTEGESTMDGYEKVLYGSLDVLAADGGARGTRQLFKLLQNEPKTDSLSGFILVVADQLIRLLDAETIRDYVLPLAHKYFVRPEHRASFEAAHAFLLALLEVASESLQRDPSQAPFVDALVQICAHGLLREARDGSVTTDQLKEAYPAVVRAATRVSPDLVHNCVQRVENIVFKTNEHEQARRSVQVSIAAYVPAPDVKAYLSNTVAKAVLSQPRGSESRTELAALAFKVVMKDFPDESKQTGIEWWLRWRRVFQSEKEMVARL